MTTTAGISQREFARLDGCDEKVVRRKIASGHLIPNADGTLDPALVGSAWRRRTYKHPIADDVLDEEETNQLDQSLLERAKKIVENTDALPTKAASERKREHFAALLKELQYDHESGLVVSIEDVTQKVGTAFSRVRNKLLSIPTRVASKIVIMKEATEVKAYLAREIALVLEELIYDAGDQPL